MEKSIRVIVRMYVHGVANPRVEDERTEQNTQPFNTQYKIEEIKH